MRRRRLRQLFDVVADGDVVQRAAVRAMSARTASNSSRPARSSPLPARRGGRRCAVINAARKQDARVHPRSSSRRVVRRVARRRRSLGARAPSCARPVRPARQEDSCPVRPKARPRTHSGRVEAPATRADEPDPPAQLRHRCRPEPSTKDRRLTQTRVHLCRGQPERVVFPAPFGPTMPQCWPCSTRQSIPRSRCRRPPSVRRQADAFFPANSDGGTSFRLRERRPCKVPAPCVGR